MLVALLGQRRALYCVAGTPIGTAQPAIADGFLDRWKSFSPSSRGSLARPAWSVKLCRGQVYLDAQSLDAKAVGKVEVDPGQTLTTPCIPARELLAQVVSATEVKLYWHLYYDANKTMYILNLLPVMRKGRQAN